MVVILFGFIVLTYYKRLLINKIFLAHGGPMMFMATCQWTESLVVNLMTLLLLSTNSLPTVYPKKYAHGFVVLCFVVVMQSFIMNSHEVFIHIHRGCFAGTGAIVRLPQCQWSKPDGYRKISQCITTTKHSKAKTVCIFLGIYCTPMLIHCQFSIKT